MINDNTMFVVIEGHNKAGKSTMVADVAQQLRASGLVVDTFRDPGGTPLGEAIRGLTKEYKQELQAIEPPEVREAVQRHLYSTSRLLLAQKIRTSRAQVVLCDRWFYSTLVYNFAHEGEERLDGDSPGIATNAPEIDAMLGGLELRLRIPDVLIILENDDVPGRGWEKARYQGLFRTGLFGLTGGTDGGAYRCRHRAFGAIVLMRTSGHCLTHVEGDGYDWEVVSKGLDTGPSRTPADLTADLIRGLMA